MQYLGLNVCGIALTLACGLAAFCLSAAAAQQDCCRAGSGSVTARAVDAHVRGFNYTFIYSCIRSFSLFVCFFVHSLVRSLIHFLTHVFLYSSSLLFVFLSIHLFIQKIVHSFTCPFTYSNVFNTCITYFAGK